MKKWRDQFVCSKWLNINKGIAYENIKNHPNVIGLEEHFKIFIRKKTKMREQS
jgi:hypothetical protein